MDSRDDRVGFQKKEKDWAPKGNIEFLVTPATPFSIKPQNPKINPHILYF